MKIVVIGGTGLIGSKVVAKLQEKGHDARIALTQRAANAPAAPPVGGAQ